MNGSILFDSRNIRLDGVTARVADGQVSFDGRIGMDGYTPSDLALTATGRASATVLTLFPVALVFLMTLINPDYMIPFLQSGTGQVLMVYSIISIAIGAFLLSRIVSVKG